MAKSSALAQQLLKIFKPRQQNISRLSGFERSCQLSASQQTRSASYKTRHIEQKVPPPSSTPVDPASRIRTYAIWALAGVFVAIGVGKQLENNREKKIFDPPRFTPFEIIKREEVSPTSIILTLRPRNLPSGKDAEDPYREEWENGIWSVEFKQPELQIARRYTPLPPVAGTSKTDLRFLIRKEHKGEMSGYLHTLSVGAEIGLRGPHREINLPDKPSHVVFLAAGTGIAPALQVANTLLKRENIVANAALKNEHPMKSRIHIVWANRRREDCVGGLSSSKLLPGTKSGKLVQELDDLQKRFPGQIKVDYLVDEEGSFLNHKVLSQITKANEASSNESAQWILISGPEGFVNYVAGPKKWENGKEVQGPLGGILGHKEFKDWIVTKL